MRKTTQPRLFLFSPLLLCFAMGCGKKSSDTSTPAALKEKKIAAATTTTTTTTTTTETVVTDVTIPPSGSIRFTTNATQTHSSALSLSLDSTNATQMYITNTANCASDGVWESFAALKSWAIPATSGSQSVYAKFADALDTASECVSSSIQYAPWDIGTYIKASNLDAGASFGWASALSADGLTLAVSAAFEDSAATGINGSQHDDGFHAGAVYVFTRTSVSTPWSQQAFIKPAVLHFGDGFGWSISLSADGSLLAVGAADEDSNATGIGGSPSDTNASNSGAVYTFTRSGTTWSQQAYIKAPNIHTGYYLGYMVALSADGSTLAASAMGDASNATGIGGDPTNTLANASGAVYVFTQLNGTWSQQAYIKASNSAANYYFGSSALALSSDGSTLAVGATGENSGAKGINGDQADTSAANSGAAYVFTRAGSTWSQEAYIKASNTAEQANFGFALALSGSGTTLVVSAIGESSSAKGVNGTQSDTSITGAGAAYVFTKSGDTWNQQAYLKASNTATNLSFGTTAALSSDGTTLAIAASGENSAAIGNGGDQANTGATGSGAVYMFSWDGTNWSQQAYLKASNTHAGDNFGGSIGISSDGVSMAVGANNESSSTTGINGTQSNTSATSAGSVYGY